jgi:hypothetical protein
MIHFCGLQLIKKVIQWGINIFFDFLRSGAKYSTECQLFTFYKFDFLTTIEELSDKYLSEKTKKLIGLFDKLVDKCNCFFNSAKFKAELVL